ncbi:hypothetical protein HY993_04725 [Candidatus Micrarchaeota archaeon]|nr:hypothetical protein [Candidatus Micrarchaeota archaeon]
MAEESMACPNCGNPQLDVDAANSVVYCQQCGFAVKVDPNTGEATPINQGRAPGSSGGVSAPLGGAGPNVFGMDKLTFLLLVTAVLLLLTFMYNLDLTIFAVIEAIAVALFFLKR